MNLLRKKKILLGITGGIAAYKTPLLVRALIKSEAEVQVIMTPSATDFVSPLTLSVLSKREVYSTFTSPAKDHDTWNDHVALGGWADLFLVAPATANTIADLVHAKSNSLVTATYLSCTCPVLLAPAMDLDMYAHTATQQNLKKLTDNGVEVLPAGDGALASGLSGKGRMLEPDTLVSHIEAHFAKNAPLGGKKVLITAGPTYEPIDPVRFIGNFSSGKMGLALAEAAHQMGAEVLLVIGPNSLPLQEVPFQVIPVVTANEMHQCVIHHYSDVDIAIAAAAVADFSPQQKAPQKIKKSNGLTAIPVAPTPDILAAMGELKQSHQFLVGFALESEHGVQNAKKKLKAKNLDAIVLNSLEDAGAGFGTETNKITYIRAEKEISYELKSKNAVAHDIFSAILQDLDQ